MFNTQLGNSYHQRSFSFSNWESAGKPQTKYYYNYRSKQNQYRGDMPTFGQGSDRRVRQFYSRNLNTQFSYETQSKIKRELQLQSKPNYSLDNWNKATKLTRHKQPDQYYGNMNNLENINIKKCNYSYQKNSTPSYINTKPSRLQFEKATQQKLTNIDKINEKIKKILNTLNQEQKKINQHHIKVGNKKLSSQVYAQRIKTQGNDYYKQNTYNLEDSRNVYSKLTGIRQRYHQNQDNYLKDISNNSYLQRTRKVVQFQQSLDNKYNHKYQNKQYSRESNDQYTRQYHPKKSINQSPFNLLKDTHQIKQYKQNICQKREISKKQGVALFNKQHKKYQGDSALKFLKGTNAKSTDSLNLSTSICIKKQNQPYMQQKIQNYKESKKYNENLLKVTNQCSKDYKKISLNQNNSRFFKGEEGRSLATKNFNRNQIQQESSPQIDLRKQSIDRKKIQQMQFKCINLNQAQNKISPTFHDFENNNKHDRTPLKSKNQRSFCKLERSQKSCKLSNGKDLDVQIQKIQKKIQNCQNIKRSLNIQDDEAGKKSRISLNKSLNKYKQNRASVSRNNLQVKNKDYDNFTEKSDKRTITISQFSSQKISMRQNSFADNKKTNYRFQSQNNDVQVSLPKPFKMAQKKATRRTTVNNSAVKEIQSTLISQQRMETNQQSLKNLINKLCEQIQFDTNFRNSKKWFNRKMNSSKWYQLSKQLSNHKIGTNDQQNRQIFTMTEIQDNPFHTDRDQEGSYKMLIENFLTSQKFWIDNLQHRFTREQIQKNIMQMDIERKGNITIEDMVRYINLQSDKYYRNRDLSLIYRRLSGTRGEVTVEYILSQFCRN